MGMFEALSDALIDNIHVKLRSNVIDAFQAIQSRQQLGSDFDSRAIQDRLQRILIGVDTEKAGSTFKQSGQLDILRSKVKFPTPE